MAEEKLRYLMHCVKEELSAGLVRNPPITVTQFVSKASTIGKALEMRAKQYDRHFVGAANANCVDGMRIPMDSLRGMIHAVVWEELRKLFPTMPQPQVASPTDKIRGEV